MKGDVVCLILLFSGPLWKPWQSQGW